MTHCCVKASQSNKKSYEFDEKVLRISTQSLRKEAVV